MKAWAILAAGIGLAVAATPAGAVSAQISLSLPVLAQVTGLNDVAFTSVAPESDAVNSQNVCVWSNTLSNGYSVTAAGSGTGSAFTLAASGGAKVAYDVGWAGSSGASSTTTLSPGVASTTFSSTALVPGCTLGASSTATFRITIKAANLQTMQAPAIYTGSLTLTITPM